MTFFIKYRKLNSMRRKLLLLVLLLVRIDLTSSQLRYNYTPYSFDTLEEFPFKASHITLTAVIEETPEYISYKGYFTTMNRKMSLYFGLPKGRESPPSHIHIMIRDFQLHYNYIPGQAIKNIAKKYLQEGIAVIAPDFFGFGDSDEPPIGTANAAEAYLIMPINVSELYLSLSQQLKVHSQTIAPTLQPSLPDYFSKISLWGRGDGGFVALHSLALLKEPIPTVLWSPTTIDFASAWTFFRSQYSAIAGKSAQKFLEYFNQSYAIHNFTISRNLFRIASTTPIRLHHGSLDEHIPVQWTQKFIDDIKEENSHREANQVLPIKLEYHIHPKATHDLANNDALIIANDISWLKSLKIN